MEWNYESVDTFAYENDSGWSFMAGNEDDEYVADYSNIKLLSIAGVCQLDSDVLIILIILSEQSLYEHLRMK